MNQSKLTQSSSFGSVGDGLLLFRVNGGIPVHRAHSQAIVLNDLIKTLALVAAETSENGGNQPRGHTFNLFMTIELLADMTSATLSSMDQAMAHASNPRPSRRWLKALGSALLAIAIRLRRV